jgi:DNA-binding NarL/FixJ family response regulator
MFFYGPGDGDGSLDIRLQSRSLALGRGPVSILTILLADDNAAVLKHVGRMLGRHKNYEVVGAIVDGTTVVREYLRLRPNLIVLDISMGGVSGIDVARQLRESGCDAKIIFLTVHEDRDYVNAAIGAGGSAYVVKSRISSDLLTAIDAALADKLFVSASLTHERG